MPDARGFGGQSGALAADERGSPTWPLRRMPARHLLCTLASLIRRRRDVMKAQPLEEESDRHYGRFAESAGVRRQLPPPRVDRPRHLDALSRQRASDARLLLSGEVSSLGPLAWLERVASLEIALAGPPRDLRLPRLLEVGELVVGCG